MPGTRRIVDQWGVVGAALPHPGNPYRIWRVHSLFGPVRRKLGGIRARVVDGKGFVSFVNQRDLEILLGIAKPGDWCSWAKEEYPETGTPAWFGYCVDRIDLVDDLHDRELFLRSYFPNGLAPGAEIRRRVHQDGIDTSQLLLLIRDEDPHTHRGPDTKIENIEYRWALVEDDRETWNHLPFTDPAPWIPSLKVDNSAAIAV